MLRNSVLVLGAIVVFAFAYYALSPLFKVITINEEPPQSLTGENSTTTTVFSSTKQPIVDTLTHPATGTVHIVQSDGEVTLRYENFKTINGPDLFVYLSKDLDATDFVNLGELKATEGNVNYPIPADIDVRQYRYALVWCKQFGVLFNYAELSPLTAASTTEPASTQRNATAPTVDITSQSSDTLSTAPKTALFGNGCFWCVESDLEKVPGVITAVSGYAGGTDQSPTYENYDDSGHREVVLVTYDPGRVSYANLVEHILKHGDPTDATGSFGDRGLEYAPAIYYENESEETAAKAVIAAVDTRGVLPAPLTIPVLPRTTFWPAEEYHQDYAQKNPVRYKYYRTASGRDAFIEKYWGESAGQMTFSNGDNSSSVVFKEGWWQSYVRPDETTLRQQLTSLQYHVTQENGTEPAFKNIYDKHYEDGIYVDIVSGEPLFLSKDKYDSGTGWPSFVRPINDSVITLHEDNTLFTKRTEVRSRFANSHLGHVFNDGPQDRGGKRYCMNSAALRFIPKDDMERLGYGFLRAQM